MGDSEWKVESGDWRLEIENWTLCVGEFSG